MEYIAGRINTTVRGWIDYYGAFFKSEPRSEIPLNYLVYALNRFMAQELDEP